jgi:hypothetical protein
MARSLKRDHILGAVTAAGAAVILLWAALSLKPPVLERLLFAIVLADWIRLVMMIRRHQRLLTTEGTT